MADTKISAATSTTPATTDLIPLERPGSAVARQATIAAIVQAQAASTTAKGAVELATAAEAKAGSSSSLAVTPAGLAYAIHQVAGAVGDGVTDDTAAIQAAMTANDNIYLPAGTYKCSSALTPNANANIIGDGVDLTILDFSGWNGVCVYACKRIDGLTILGNDTAGSIGIQADDTHVVNKCSWGTIRLRHLQYGCKLIPQTYNGFYYNQFGTWYVEECTYGLYIYPNNGTGGYVNDNFWTLFRGDNNTTAIYARYASGITMTHLSLELNTLGLDLDNGEMLNAFSGWMEANTTAYTIGSSWNYFRYFGLIASGQTRSEPPGNSTAASVSIRDGTSAAQKWWGDHYFNRMTFFNLDPADAAFPYEGIWYPKIRGAAYPHASWASGATKDVTTANVWYLTHGVSTEITGMTGTAGQTVTLIDMNGSGNAYVNSSGNFVLSANWTPNGYRDNLTLWTPDGSSWWEFGRVSI